MNMKEMMKIPQNNQTKDQVALIMFLFGTKEQKIESLKYLEQKIEKYED